MVATSGTHEAGAGKLDLSGLEIDVDPRLEWRQMFSEVWRNARDYFYDDTLHSVDWKGMRERYQPYLADVRYRVDLNYVLGQLVGELVNSHIRVGGPEPPKPEASPAGLLGADYEVVDGRYRVTRIVPAPYWEEQANPLTVPGVDVEEGAIPPRGGRRGASTSHETSIRSSSARPGRRSRCGWGRRRMSRALASSPSCPSRARGSSGAALGSSGI